MITVTRPWMPSRARLDYYLDMIYQSGHLTNNGPLVQLLERRLKEYLDVKHLILVGNGTLALQVAYEALELSGEVITSPFSFIATASSIAWQKYTPVFADINPVTFNIDPNKVEEKITNKTSAIVPVHVFGNPCAIDALHGIAKKHNLKLIYDAAHAFGVEHKDQSLLNHGHISTLSFHATKLFHTIEGGALITDDDALADKIRLMIKFGIPGEDRVNLCGINAKMNEFSAAMGLCVLDDIETIKKQRFEIWELYRAQLNDLVEFQVWANDSSSNHAYVPIILRSEKQLIEIKQALEINNIMPRRYFYPSLDTLDFLGETQTCVESQSIAKRILCLPIYPSLKLQECQMIIDIIRHTIKTNNTALASNNVLP